MAERRSRYHGLTSEGHGPDEHGLGGLESPEDPRDLAVGVRPDVDVHVSLDGAEH